LAVVDTARSIAEDVLFPAAASVDAADRVPPTHLDLLAAQGFYGLDVPLPELCRVVEILASGCLATTFVWLQHFSALRAAAGTRWYRPLARGELRAGVVQAALRPGAPSVRARRVDGGYLFDGEAPWVTGWDMVDVLHTAARDEHDTVVWALLDAVAGDALTVELLDLVAVRASRTVLVRFDGYFVPDERVTRIHPFAEWAARDAANLRLNGSLALGLTGRCVALLDSVPLREALDGCRGALDAGTPGMAEARAAASALAARAAAVLATAHGAGAVLRGSIAERLTREALFLLVFGSRPAIKAALTGRLLS
jgi:alkylation response protein AidB-like acyl-CoA dehydrogenase